MRLSRLPERDGLNLKGEVAHCAAAVPLGGRASFPQTRDTNDTPPTGRA